MADQPVPQPAPLRDSFGVAICNRECPHWLGDSCELNRKWLIAEKDPCIPQARRDAAELAALRDKPDEQAAVAWRERYHDWIGRNSQSESPESPLRRAVKKARGGPAPVERKGYA